MPSQASTPRTGDGAGDYQQQSNCKEEEAAAAAAPAPPLITKERILRIETMGRHATFSLLESWISRQDPSSTSSPASDAIASDSLSNTQTTGGKAFDRFTMQANGSYDYSFSVEDLENDETTVDMALSSIDGDYSENERFSLRKGQQEHPQDRRQRTQNIALLALGMFVVAMFVGLMPLATKKRNSNAGYVGDAFRPLGDETMIQCSGQSGKISFEQWLNQDAENEIATLCDPIFLKFDETADASRTPVKVFILMGEANMVGTGTVHGADAEGTLEYTVLQKERFAQLRDPDTDTWKIRKDVRYVGVQGDFQIERNGWLQVDDSREYFGMEAQVGYILGEVFKDPVLIIKAASGHNSLGGDLLPPGSERYVMDGFVYPGTGESPRRWDVGTAPSPNNWRAGARYEEYVSNVKRVLHNIGTYYPGASTYEISGFVWWQGDSDRRVPAYAAKYEENMIRLINALRFDFRAPNAKVVAATLGQNGADMTGGTLEVWEAQKAVSNYQKYPQHLGHVATVDVKSSWRGPYLPGHDGDSAYLDAPHYGSNAETMLEVGNAVGLKMVQLLAQG